MTIGSILSARLSKRYGQPEYSEDLIDEFIEIMGTTYTEYNPQVYFAKDKDEGIPEGANLYLFGGGEYWYTPLGGGFITSAVNEQVVAAGVAADEGGTEFLMVDIEAWDLATEREEMIENLLKALIPWHESGKRPIGMYKQLPYATFTPGSDLKAAIDSGNLKSIEIARSKITAYMLQNDVNYAILGQYVDLLIPRCYAVSASTWASWKWAIGLQLCEALRIANGKPVYPIMWFRYNVTGFPELSEADYTEALKFLSSFPGIAGTIIWVDSVGVPSGYDYTSIVTALINSTGEFAPPLP